MEQYALAGFGKEEHGMFLKKLQIQIYICSCRLMFPESEGSVNVVKMGYVEVG